VSHLLPRPAGTLASANITLVAGIKGEGNWSVTTATAIVDRAAPTLLLRPTPPVWTLGEPLAIVAEASDGGAVVSVQANHTRDGTRLANLTFARNGDVWSSTVTFDARGNHTLAVRARDAAGNVATQVRHVFARPVPPPTLRILNVTENATLEQASLRLLVEDPLGIASLTVATTDGMHVVTVASPNGTLVVPLADLRLAPGNHSLDVLVVNNAGSRSNATLRLAILAPPAPPPEVAAIEGKEAPAGLASLVLALAIAVLATARRRGPRQ